MIAAAAVASTVSFQADARTHSKSIIVESPSDLPEMAQRNNETMYLYYTEDGRAILYLESGWQGLPIAEVVPLGNIARAHELMEHPAKAGKVIVAIQ